MYHWCACASPCLCQEGDPHYDWPDGYSLEIKNVTRKDAGVYTVKCTNDEGVNQTSIMLDVQCKTQHTLNTQAHTHFNSVRCALFKRFCVYVEGSGLHDFKFSCKLHK